MRDGRCDRVMAAASDGHVGAEKRHRKLQIDIAGFDPFCISRRQSNADGQNERGAHVSMVLCSRVAGNLQPSDRMRKSRFLQRPEWFVAPRLWVQQSKCESPQD